MRVQNKILLAKLYQLKLDQQSFGLAKAWMATLERLKSAEQTCLFLRRCYRENVIPTSFRQPCRMPQEIRASRFIERLQKNLSKKLIRISIRQKFDEIARLKESSSHLRERLASDDINELMEQVSVVTKKDRKVSLIKKFNWLREKSTGDHRPQPEEHQKTQTSRERVSIIGDIDVPEAAVEAFAKGPNFAIEKKITKEELQRISQVEIAALAYALRWKAASATETTMIKNTPGTDTTEQTPVSISRNCPFKLKRIAPPRTNMDIEKSIKAFHVDMDRIVSRNKTNVNSHQNISPRERNAIRELTSNSDICITRSDKGGEIVIMSTKEIHDLNMEHLGDTRTYEKLKKDPTHTLRLTVNKTLRDIMTRGGFSPSLIQRFQTPPSARTQHFYTLPKTHKQTLKIRPIVSGRNGIFDRLGWSLQFLLRPLLKQVRAHISSTAELINKFEECPRTALKGKIPISFDVVSLYTNIDVEEAISTTLQYIQKYDTYLYGLTSCDINNLLHLLLENNVFEYPRSGIFRQIRGLAMGSRLSGTLAILTMDRFERLYIYRTVQPTIYVRYVDDTGMVVDSIGDAQRMLTYLNSKHTSIKFELELPSDDGYLPILDTAIKINQDGSLSYRLYTKPASKQITLHHDSHHPDSVKKAIISNEIRRAAHNSSPENSAEAMKSVISKLVNNGYPAETIQRTIRNPRKNPRQEKGTNPLTFRLPFISNRFDAEVRRALARHNINARIIHPRPQTLLQLAQPRTKPLDCKLRSCPIPYISCTARFVVYGITCEICKAVYIGSTTRALHDRAKEHIAAAKKRCQTSAVGEHYKVHHPTEEPRLRFCIIRRTEKDELRLRIEEALTINEIAPAMNRRSEDMGLNFLTF